MSNINVIPGVNYYTIDIITNCVQITMEDISYHSNKYINN